MLVNAFLFDMSDPDNPTIILVQKVDQSDRWALPGGKSLDDECPLDACCREIADEVGPNAADAVPEYWDELEIDRGKYKQYVFVTPFSGKLRKKGLKEKDDNGNLTESLGPPTWVHLSDVSRGIVTVGKEFSEIYPSHMNAIAEALIALADYYPELKHYAEATKPYAWDKG